MSAGDPDVIRGLARDGDRLRGSELWLALRRRAPIETPHEAALVGGWQPAADLGHPTYQLDPWGIVHLSGAAQIGGQYFGRMFTLPAQYRPEKAQRLAGGGRRPDGDLAAGGVDVHPDGQLVVGSIEGWAWFSLAGLTYRR